MGNVRKNFGGHLGDSETKFELKFAHTKNDGQNVFMRVKSAVPCMFNLLHVSGSHPTIGKFMEEILGLD